MRSDILPLSLKNNSFEYNGKKRYLSIDKGTSKPFFSLSIYECYLSHKTNSWNSISSQLNKLSYLFTWALSANYDIEKDLLTGSAPAVKHIRTFAYWLRERKNQKTMEPLGVDTYNLILTEACQMYVFFIEQYGTFSGTPNERSINSDIVTTSIKKMFKDLKRKTRKKNYAPDITEEEIKDIENYLKPEKRIEKLKKIRKKLKPETESQIYRDYLIWRLTIEFGLRLSEILALRLEDCPHRDKNYISIVRIEERGNNYQDPRDYPPRPKTLSRNLGFLLEDSPLPALINEYITKHRFRKAMKQGKSIRIPVLDQPQFLILSHQFDLGNPLSIRAAENISDKIREGTGIPFHWHLSRHAFFNRAYSAIADSPDFKDRKQDLIYWGGWEDEKSLDIYVRRARKERAQKALIFWQEGGTSWEALS